MTTLLALALALEKLHIRQWFGISRLVGLVLGLVGAAYMLGLNNLGGNKNALIGNCCLLVQTFSFACYIIAQRPLLKVYGSPFCPYPSRSSISLRVF
jgi:drug/metabolite transporter (DMT)-like permease